ncbi:MAG: DUF2059 domain-containing protein [Azospirillaceae bacterium]
MAIPRLLRPLAAVCGVAFILAATGSASAQVDLRERLRDYAVTYMEASLGEAVIDPMVAQLGPQFYPLNPGRQADVDAAVHAAIERLFDHVAPDMTDQVVDFLWRELSEEDLQVMLDFYDSPTGQRILAITPQLMAEMMGDMPTMMQETQTVLIEALTEEFASRDLDLGM